MTDKQIIIDGCDVSGCEFLRNCIIPDNYGCKIDDSLCCDVGNCYYKQLKRKEQECEELKKFLNQIRDEELSHLDIEWDEYETSARQEDYSNIITLVERALGEIDD